MTTDVVTVLYTLEDGTYSSSSNPNAFGIKLATESSKITLRVIQKQLPLELGAETDTSNWVWYSLADTRPIVWETLSHANQIVKTHRCKSDGEATVVLKIVNICSRHNVNQKDPSDLSSFYVSLLLDSSKPKNASAPTFNNKKMESTRASTSISTAKLTKDVSSAMGSIASWAKKGIAQATENIATVKMMANGIAGDSTFEIGNHRVTIVNKIAEGGFSEVFSVVAKSGGTTKKLAMKRCLAQSTEDEKTLLQEIKLHQQLNHPNIMPLLGELVQETTRVARGKDVIMLFPLYVGGSVNEKMFTEEVQRDPISNWPFNERQATRIMADVCRAVQALHELGYLHRDIKPHNIMLTHADVAASKPVLIDLGSATRYPIVSSNRKEASMIQDDATVHCSAAFRSPELFEVASNSVIAEESDVWSLGCVLYAMTYGKGWSPFEDPKQGIMPLAVLNAKVKYKKRPYLSAGLETLLGSMFNRSPTDRPALDMIIGTLDSLCD